MAENRKLPKSKFQGDLKLGGIYWKDAVHVRQNEGLNQWQKNHFRLMKMVEYQESVVQGYLERLLTRIGIEYSRKEYVPTNDEILDKLMSIDPEVQKLVLLNGKAAAMEMFVKQNYDLKGRYRNIFQGGRIPRNMSMKVINDYLDEVDAPSMEPSALEDYTSQMRSELAEITQRHIAKSVAQMTAWNWSRGRGIEELTRRFQEEQEKEDIDMSKVLPNAETVIRTESMKIMNAEAWRSATEVGSYADGLLWGFSYHAVGDSRTRETHLAQHGVCAPVDDPFWNEWTPPNGYNCRCWLISEWEEPSSYKQPRRDLQPDPGFAFNPANNVAGRVLQQKKAEPKKPEVNAQSESNVKPDELGKNDATSEKNFEKKRKNIQKPVTSSKKKRYNNIGSKNDTASRTVKFTREFVNTERRQLFTSPDGRTYAVSGTSVEEIKSVESKNKRFFEISNNTLNSVNTRRDDKGRPVHYLDDISIGIESRNVRAKLNNCQDKNEVIDKSIEILQNTLLGNADGLTQILEETILERSICLDKNGKVIAYDVGSTYSVNMSFDKETNTTGGIQIHSHPSGSPPSYTDLYNLWVHEWNELIIVLPFGKYIVRILSRSIGDEKFKELVRNYHTLSNAIIELGKYDLVPEADKSLFRILASQKIGRVPKVYEVYEQYEYLLYKLNCMFRGVIDVKFEK